MLRPALCGAYVRASVMPLCAGWPQTLCLMQRLGPTVTKRRLGRATGYRHKATSWTCEWVSVSVVAGLFEEQFFPFVCNQDGTQCVRTVRTVSIPGLLTVKGSGVYRPQRLLRQTTTTTFYCTTLTDEHPDSAQSHRPLRRSITTHHSNQTEKRP